MAVSKSVASPSRDVRRDAFLLFNKREPAVELIRSRLRQRGISTWFSQRELRVGDDWSAIERAALEAASVVVVFLGTAGWGPTHRQFTAEAIKLGKNLIPVLLGPPGEASLAEFGDVFSRPQRVEFRRPGDEQAMDALVSAIEREINADPHRPKPGIEASRIVRKLIEGDDDDRAETLDDLAGIAKTHDNSVLWKLLLDKIQELTRDADGDGAHASIRAALFSALAVTIDDKDENELIDAVYKTLLRHLDPAQEPSWQVRFAIVANAFRSGLIRLKTMQGLDDPDPSVKALSTAIEGRDNPKFHEELRATLVTGDAQPFLRALGVVAIPALVKDICAAMVRTNLAFCALTEPSIIEQAAVELKNGYPSEFVARCAASASLGAGRYLTRRLGGLLVRLDSAQVTAELRRIEANENDLADGASRLLNILDEGRDCRVIAGYTSDATDDSKDELDIRLEVQTLCSVMLAKDVQPPLSIGLFGDWGTGKSYFMKRMYAEVDDMRENRIAAEGLQARFHTKVAQVEFNAWHYIDANLWASLVSHIIEELAKQVNPNQDVADTRKALVGELETAKELKSEVVEERNRAVEARTAAEDKLTEVAKERADRQVKLADLRATDYWRLVQNDPALQASLQDAARELGLPSAVSGIRDLDAAILQAHSTAGRAKAIVMSIATHGSVWPMVSLIVILIVGVPAAVWLLKYWPPAGLSAILSNVVVGLAICGKAIKEPLAIVNRALAKLDEARKRASTLIEEKKRAGSREEIGLEKQVNELRAKEESATQQLSNADARIQEIEVKIREIDEGRSLAKYLLQRFQTEDYRKHLGLVSTIRRDFDKLGKLLEVAAERENEEPIQRIILYVDDLDRCPAPRVLEVLQAVHLLLAFNLFVVVVGVDPRWLLHSLEKSYSAFQTKGRGRGREWITTPQNYLEKIFQIPFSLRPMDKSGYSRLMRTLLSLTAEDGEAVVPNEQRATASSAKQEERAIAIAASASGTFKPVVDSSERPDQREGDKRREEPASKAKKAVTGTLNYDALRIRSWELAFVERLFQFVPSPRAAKRFTNIYRLLKAPLNGEHLRRFEGTDTMPGDFRAAMVLLAILTGFPDSASRVFASVLDKKGSDLPSAEFFANAAGCGILQVDISRFTRFLQPLLADGLPDTLEAFVEWMPRVARFSFETAEAARAAHAM